MNRNSWPSDPDGDPEQVQGRQVRLEPGEQSQHEQQRGGQKCVRVFRLVPSVLCCLGGGRWLVGAGTRYTLGNCDEFFLNNPTPLIQYVQPWLGYHGNGERRLGQEWTGRGELPGNVIVSRHMDAPKKKDKPLLFCLHLFFISSHETHIGSLPGVVSGWLISQSAGPSCRCCLGTFDHDGSSEHAQCELITWLFMWTMHQMMKWISLHVSVPGQKVWWTVSVVCLRMHHDIMSSWCHDVMSSRRCKCAWIDLMISCSCCVFFIKWLISITALLANQIRSFCCW